MRKVLSFLLSLSLVIALIPTVRAEEYSYEAPLEPQLWTEPDFSTDHAYSIAFVGDTQYICRGDALQGTKKMDQLFGTIAQTAKERKLAHVFVLGDITDMGYRNDANLGYSIFHPPRTEEWEAAQKAILQMSEAGVPYSLCRGNHDDYLIDDYFNIPAYTDQFKDSGGFFSDSDARHAGGHEERNPEGYVYWSALTGYHKNSIVNSYKTVELFGTKYLFLTVDHHLTMNLINWVNEILEKYPDHLAIVTTHAYIGSSGNLFSTTQGDTACPNGLASEDLWEFALKHHENVLMVVSGHVGTLRPVYSTVRRGVNGNVVRQILVDPQNYDLREDIENRGVQDTGMVLYMNFSEDGKKVTFDYYSTLLNKEMVDADYPLTLYQKNPVADKKAVQAEAEADPAPPKNELEEEQLSEPASSIGTVALIGGAIVLILLSLFLLTRKKKKA